MTHSHLRPVNNFSKAFVHGSVQHNKKNKNKMKQKKTKKKKKKKILFDHTLMYHINKENVSTASPNSFQS